MIPTDGSDNVGCVVQMSGKVEGSMVRRTIAWEEKQYIYVRLVHELFSVHLAPRTSPLPDVN
jgi:hypothetical protein